MADKLKVIITGATGMVGEGVLQECLMNGDVTEILSISRKPSGVLHPKLTEIIHYDFFDLEAIEPQLTGYNACLFCLGVSSVGMGADEYYKMTYTLTLSFASVVSRLNRDMVFCYISGAGTDGSEQGRSRWARVKGKTENDLAKLSFKKVYNFRPGMLVPAEGAKNVLPLYKYLGWLAPFIKLVYPNGISTIKQLGEAMIYAAAHGYDKTVIEVKDIHTITRGS